MTTTVSCCYFCQKGREAKKEEHRSVERRKVSGVEAAVLFFRKLELGKRRLFCFGGGAVLCDNCDRGGEKGTGETKGTVLRMLKSFSSASKRIYQDCKNITQSFRKLDMQPACTESYDCSCASCQSRNGHLGLIVRGIDSLSSQTQGTAPPQHFLDLDSHIGNNPYPHLTDSNQPTTHHLQQQSSRFLDSINIDYPPPVENLASPPAITYPEHNYYDTYQSYQRNQDYPSTSRGYYGHAQSPPQQIPASTTSVAMLPLPLQDFEASEQTPFHQSEDELPHSRRAKRVCRYCEKQFSHTGDFKKHLRTHTREKPYSCGQCEKRFSHTSNLHRHERSHTGDRPYRCEYCDKEFNRKDKLESHKKSKTCRSKRREDGT